jgi:hypothetical protein
VSHIGFDLINRLKHTHNGQSMDILKRRIYSIMNPTIKLILRLAYAMIGLLGLWLAVVAGWAFLMVSYDNSLRLATVICLGVLFISLLICAVWGKHFIFPPLLAVAIVLMGFADTYVQKESNRKFCQTTYENCQADPDKDRGLCDELERKNGLARICQQYLEDNT